MENSNKVQEFIFGVIGIIVIIAIAVNCSGKKDVSQSEHPKPVFYSVTISLNYEYVPLTTNTPMNVFVGDTKLGKQEAGSKKSYTLELEEGEYDFYLKNDTIYTSPKVSFKVTPTRTSFQFGTKTALTFGMEVWAET